MSANPSEQKRGPFSSLINDWESGLGLLKQRAVLGVESVRTRLAPIKQKGVNMARATREMSFLTKVEVGIAGIGVVTAMTELIHAFPYAVGLEDPKDYHPLVVPAVLGMFENMFPPVSSVEDGPIPIPTLVPVTPEGTPLSVGVFPPGTAVVEATGEVITVTPAATETATGTPTETQTAEPTATERVRPTEKPLPGELFRLDCTGMPWLKCWETLVKSLEPSLSQGGMGGQSFSRMNELSFNLGKERGVLDYVVKRYYSPQTVGVFILDWTAPDGEIRSDEVFVFKVRENGRNTIVPVLPLDGFAGADDNSVGIFWDVGTASASGAVMSSDVTTSRELVKKLFEEKRAVHDIAVVQETVNFQLGDPTAEFLYSQPGSPEKGIQPIRLVVEFGLKPTP